MTTTPTNELAAAESLRQAISNYDTETLLDVLDTRREQAIVRLRKAVRKLRAATEATAAAHERIARLVNHAQATTAPAAPEGADHA